MKKFVYLLVWLFIAGTAFAGFQITTQLIAQSAIIGTTNDIAIISSGWQLSFSGNWGVSLPYISLSDTTIQTVLGTVTWQAITYNTVDFSNLITLSWTSQILVQKKWLYELSFSAVYDTTSTADTIFFWIRKNWVDVPNTTTQATLKDALDMDVLTVVLADRLIVWDYIELIMWSDTVGTRIFSSGTWSWPERPEMPSVIVTMKKVSNI